MNHTAELMRLRYKYRRLLMEGAIRLPLEGAVKLMGPDCAYHLYFTVGGEEQPAPQPRPTQEPRGISDQAERKCKPRRPRPPHLL